MVIALKQNFFLCQGNVSWKHSHLYPVLTLPTTQTYYWNTECQTANTLDKRSRAEWEVIITPILLATLSAASTSESSTEVSFKSFSNTKNPSCH